MAIDPNDVLWYKDAIIYQLHVKSFFDADDDGIGDFKGLAQKLDYIKNLGATCIWLLPFFPSPLRDDGYDIADYRNVNPAYGTMRDFREFVRAAHERDIRILIELVINHTSDQHPWFQRARHAKRGSVVRDYYVWSDTPTRYADARIIFTDTETSNWTWDAVAGQYYWHRFFSHQPDLNFDNPRVVESVTNIMRFWLDTGVDALRLDAVPYLVEREGTNCENLPETHAMLKHLRTVMDAEYPGRVMLAEANQWPEDVRQYFGDGDECHMAFHFPLMPRMFMAIAEEDRYPIIDIMRQTPDIPENAQWAIFLRNHDEMTLEMVTESEREYMYRVYATEPRARINIGIRRRLAPLMENDRRRIELLAGLLMSMPGTPILYYGDEIGMGDNIYLNDRDGRPHADAVVDGSQRRLLARQSRAHVLPADHGHGLRLPGRQRRGAEFEPVVADQLGAPPDRGAPRVPRVRPRFALVLDAVQSQDHGLHPRARRRSGAVRREPLARAATDGARSRGVRRPRAGRNVRLERLSADRRRTLLDHAARSQLLLVLTLRDGQSAGARRDGARTASRTDHARAAA